MRTEKEMLDMLLAVAAADDNIRAVYIEGSRANPKVPRDLFQDYDIGFVVRDVKRYSEDPGWIDRFGERLYMQCPRDSRTDECCYWLMQLADGNRLDLHVGTPEYTLSDLELYRVLLDKDGILPQPDQTSDERYWVRRPSEEEYDAACNEFWWCLNNVAKGLWRGELPYVMYMLDCALRPMVHRLLEWRIGCEHDFSVSPGKCGKYMSRYLPRPVYEAYLSTWAEARTEALWPAVLGMCDLVDETAAFVGETLGYSYNTEEAKNSRAFLLCVKELPEDATEIDP